MRPPLGRGEICFPLLSPSHGRGTADWFGVSRDSDSTQKWQRKSIRHCSQRYGKLKPQVIRELDLPSQDNASLTSTETPPPLYVGPCQLGMQKVCLPPAASQRLLTLLPWAGLGTPERRRFLETHGLGWGSDGPIKTPKILSGKGGLGDGTGSWDSIMGPALDGRASQGEEQREGPTGGERDPSGCSGVGGYPCCPGTHWSVGGAAAVFSTVGLGWGRSLWGDDPAPRLLHLLPSARS